jgi:hypothetical protein
MWDACDINSRYQCNYGDPVVCEDTNYSSNFEVQCQCYFGNFYCDSHACPVSCPVTPLAHGDPCSASFIDGSCRYGDPFVCNSGESFDYQKECYCSDGKVYCSLNECPVSCPAAPLVHGDSCSAAFIGWACRYGDPFVCDSGESFDYQKECYCSDGKIYCSLNECPVSCPVVPLVHGDSCSAAFIGWSCRYGDPFVCDSGESFEYERECYCSGGQIYCNMNACPVPCPLTKPNDGDACSAQFINGNQCDYDKFCCGAETDGACIPDQTCSCGWSNTYHCYDKDGTLPCPFVCPKERPQMGDACDIDSRYQCNYGDPVVCDDTSYSSDFELQCHCSGGTFYCDSHACPVPCPVIPVLHGDSCSVPFADGSCRYGDPFVCNSGETFEYEKACYCSDGQIYCNSNVCPVTCPVNKPNDGDACSTPFINSNQCDYGKLCCGAEATGTCIPDKTCYCDGSYTYCNDKDGTLPCPSVCPKEAPLPYAACNIDSRYQCNYGKAVVCKDPTYSSDYELQCYCSGGHFYCNVNVCPLPCPITPPVSGALCSTPFADGYCKYGDPFVCDSGESFEYEKECFCSYYHEIYCYYNQCG